VGLSDNPAYGLSIYALGARFVLPSGTPVLGLSSAWCVWCLAAPVLRSA